MFWDEICEGVVILLLIVGFPVAAVHFWPEHEKEYHYKQVDKAGKIFVIDSWDYTSVETARYICRNTDVARFVTDGGRYSEHDATVYCK